MDHIKTLQEAERYAKIHLVELVRELRQRSSGQMLPTTAKFCELATGLVELGTPVNWRIAENMVRDAAFNFVLASAAPKVDTDPCPGCKPGTVCRTFSCGRLKARNG